MIRRDGLKLLAASAVGTGVALWSGPVLAARAETRAVFDGRFTFARAFAANHSSALDCQEDAAALWFGVLSPQYRTASTIIGLTTAADAMILADCARREGLVFTTLRSIGQSAGLVAWQIG